MRIKTIFAALLAAFGVISITPARADDLGCTVMLCLAGTGASSWKNIGECVPPVRKALRKMMRGSWRPHCSLSSGDSGEVSPGTYMESRHEQYVSCTEGYGDGYRDAYKNRQQEIVYGNGAGFFGGGPLCAKEISRTPFVSGRRPPDTANTCHDETVRSRNPRNPRLPGAVQIIRVCTDVQPKARHSSPDFFDIYIDGALHTRTYWTEDDAATDDEVPYDE